MPFPVEVVQVKAAEAKLGVLFPLGFVARMVRENGGELEIRGEVWWLHPFLDTSDRKRLKRTSNDVVRETDTARKWTDFPPNAVAIAGNGAGDRLALLPDPREPRRLGDAVFVWDHETGNVTKIADDFCDL